MAPATCAATPRASGTWPRNAAGRRLSAFRIATTRPRCLTGTQISERAPGRVSTKPGNERASSSTIALPVAATWPTTPLPSSRLYPTCTAVGSLVVSASHTKRAGSSSTRTRATSSQPRRAARASVMRWSIGRSSRSRVAIRAILVRMARRWARLGDPSPSVDPRSRLEGTFRPRIVEEGYSPARSRNQAAVRSSPCSRSSGDGTPSSRWMRSEEIEERRCSPGLATPWTASRSLPTAWASRR